MSQDGLERKQRWSSWNLRLHGQCSAAPGGIEPGLGKASLNLAECQTHVPGSACGGGGGFPDHFRVSPLSLITSLSSTQGGSSSSSQHSQALINSEWPRRAKMSANEDVATRTVTVFWPETLPRVELQNCHLEHLREPRVTGHQTWQQGLLRAWAAPQGLGGLLGADRVVRAGCVRNMRTATLETSRSPPAFVSTRHSLITSASY